jgi:hypothetical protein
VGVFANYTTFASQKCRNCAMLVFGTNGQMGNFTNIICHAVLFSLTSCDFSYYVTEVYFNTTTSVLKNTWVYGEVTTRRLKITNKHNK